jgi:hypothetical protein
MSQSNLIDITDTFKQMDLEFNKLQMNHSFFIFEIFISIYILLNLALIAEKFLMPSLLNISR